MESAHKRRIRSFVRRPGRMTASQARALDELWPDFGVSFDGQRLNPGELFGREADIVLEIGFGNGDTLIEQAATDPERNYLGIEVHEPGVGHCLIGIRNKALENVRLVMHDAIDVLRDGLPDGALQRINVYFPDPWPKKRHHKRRLIQPSFLDLSARKLVPGGTLCIATDWADYAEHIDAVLAGDARFTITETREHGGDRAIDRPMTKFERRGQRKGHRIRDWQVVRQEAPVSE